MSDRFGILEKILKLSQEMRGRDLNKVDIARKLRRLHARRTGQEYEERDLRPDEITQSLIDILKNPRGD